MEQLELTEQQLEEQEKQTELYRRLLQAYKQLFESPNGEAVLKDLKNCFYEITWLNEEGSAYKTIAGEGKRSVVLYILQMIEVANDGRINWDD